MKLLWIVLPFLVYGFEPCLTQNKCFSSIEEKNSSSFFYPLQYSGPVEYNRRKIVRVIEELGGRKIFDQGNSLKFEFTSFIFITSNIEVYLGESGVIHLKSYLEKGFFDFGVNKSILGDISFRFQQSR